MKEITNYYQACEAIKDKFIEVYFDGDDSYGYWVANRIGEIYYINDYFFDFSNMITALEFNATEKQLFYWHDFYMEIGEKNMINFENYIKYSNELLAGKSIKNLIKKNELRK